MDDYFQSVLIIITSILFSGFFSGMEIAFISANKLQIEIDRNKGTLPARIIARFSSNPSEFISSVLLGNNIALVIYGLYTAYILEPFIVKNISDIGWLVLLIQTIISTLLILITGEFLPKAFFRINPNRILKIGAIPLLVTYYILWLPTKFTMLVSKGIFAIFNVTVEKEQDTFTKVDLGHFLQNVNERMDDEVELDHEIQILQNALDFRKVKARDCMIPRTEIEAIEVESSIEDLKKQFIESGYSKILVYRDSIDNIIGFTRTFDLFDNPTKITKIISPISLVPEAMRASEILEKFIEEKRNIAVVIDEYGGTSGILTIEDVIEEIFGEIEDEYDTEDHVEKQLDENTFVFSARMEVDLINEKYNLKLPEDEEYDTLGGMVFHHMEKIPIQGENFTISNFKFTVMKASETRVELVKIQLLEDQ
ncbi:MAG: HlyC/CorC family transporter [Crocinitomicaceae bacterium]|nr:HlyC/CorC family transporter [Crocinitomicaceae bacterium]